MRRMLSMFKVQVIQTIRDRGELVSILVLPLALTWVFGVAFGGDIYQQPMVVLWLDGDTGVYAEEIRYIAEAEESIEIEDAVEAEVVEKLDSGEAGMAVRVPEGFSDDLEAGGQATIEMVIPPDSQTGQVAVEILQGAVARVSANVEAARVTVDAMGSVTSMLPPGFESDNYTAPEEPTFADVYETADAYWEPDPPVEVSGIQVTESAERGDAVHGAKQRSVLGRVHADVRAVRLLRFCAGDSRGARAGHAPAIAGDSGVEAGHSRRQVVWHIGVGAIEAFILIGFGALGFGVPWGSNPAAVDPADDGICALGWRPRAAGHGYRSDWKSTLSGRSCDRDGARDARWLLLADRDHGTGDADHREIHSYGLGDVGPARCRRAQPGARGRAAPHGDPIRYGRRLLRCRPGLPQDRLGRPGTLNPRVLRSRR